MGIALPYWDGGEVCHIEVSGGDFTASWDGPAIGALAGRCGHSEVSGGDFTASWDGFHCLGMGIGMAPPLVCLQEGAATARSVW